MAGFDFGFANKVSVPRSSESEVGSIFILTDQILEIKLDIGADMVAGLMNILGGTVKIYQKIAPKEAKLIDLLQKENISKKIICALSNFSQDKFDSFREVLTAKKILKIPIRVIDGKDDNRLSSAQSFQYRMDGENIEYGLFSSGWGRLIAVQNINEWTRHDFGKPRSDAKSGMLPPKLARMMVNLAVSQVENSKHEYRSSKQIESNSNSKNSKHVSNFEFRYSNLRPLVADPFCGSGNVLIEALSIGCDVIGSDISEKAVEDTKANLEWLNQNAKIPTGSAKARKNQNDSVKCKIFQADATKYDFGGIDRDFVVVTEPYLGQPRNHKLTIEEEKEVKEDIIRLYRDFLKNLLAAGNRLLGVCLVFPLFELANGKKLSIFDQCIDFIAEIGYDIICPPSSGETSSCKAGPSMEYGRDYQVVKREVVLLQFKA